MFFERLSVVLVTSFIARGFFLLVPLMVTPLVLKNIGVGKYSIIGVFAFIQSAIALLDLGIVPTLVREISILRARNASDQVLRNTLRTVELIYAGLAVSVVIFGGLSGGFVAFYWMKIELMDEWQVTLIFLVMSVGASASFMNGLYSATMVAMNHQLRLNILSILISLFGAAISICGLVIFYWDLPEFVTCQAGISWMSLAIMRRFAWRTLPSWSSGASFDHAILSSLRRFATGMSITQLLAVISMNLDRILLARLLPATSFGHYALASSIASSLSGVGHPIISVVTPKLMYAFGSEDRVDAIRHYHFYSQMVSVIVFPVIVTAVIFAEPLLLAWLDDIEIARAASFPFQLLAIGWLLNVLMNLPYVVQLAHGWVKLGLFGLLAALIIQLPILVYFVPRFGISAGAWSWLIMELGFFFIAIPLMHRYILKGEAFEWYLRDVSLPGFGAVIVNVLSFMFYDYILVRFSLGRISMFLYVGITIFLSMITSVLLANKVFPAIKKFRIHKSS